MCIHGVYLVGGTQANAAGRTFEGRLLQIYAVDLCSHGTPAHTSTSTNSTPRLIEIHMHKHAKRSHKIKVIDPRDRFSIYFLRIHYSNTHKHISKHSQTVKILKADYSIMNQWMYILTIAPRTTNLQLIACQVSLKCILTNMVQQYDDQRNSVACI